MNLLRIEDIVAYQFSSKMDIHEKVERVVIKFLVKSFKTDAKIRNMLTTAYGNNTMSYSTLSSGSDDLERGVTP